MTDPLDGVGSEAVRWVAEQACAEGGAVQEVADWSKARVVHMRGALSPDLRRRAEAQWPQLVYYAEPGRPHNAADEGFTDGGFSISFPTGAR